MYNSADIPDRIKSLAKARKIAIKTMLIDLSMGPNTMSNFKTSMPKSDTLARIADYLDCSVDYLLGRTDNPKSHLAPADFDFSAFDPADFIVGVQAAPPAESKAAQ